MLTSRRSFHGLDAILLTLLLGAAGFVVYRITYHLDYTWNWSVIPQFLFRYDQEEGRWVSNYLIHGLLTTIRLSVWSSILALTLGLFMALARTGRSLYWRMMARTYIELMRNLPPLVIIFLFYFFLANQLIPLLDLDILAGEAAPFWQGVLRFCFGQPEQLSVFLSAVITLAVFESAYVAEILRSGIESIGRSQWDAAQALGLTRGQILRHVILPQAFRRVLPPLAGQMISLIKDSAIVSVISIQELTYQGTQLMASTYLTIEVWLTIAAMYFLLTFPCSLAVDRMDQQLNRTRLRG
ncbi:ABC transporter permease subunit [Desulfobulbus alkaliphilus]|uniref:ABC transporter permease subunit n=1 Tax=Desulfobulbus alkaliphilus TaxID=869814 RepID=UPI001966888B|nr:amino acid ABC transporter permease [Desulfobulbus alkaliphilus]